MNAMKRKSLRERLGLTNLTRDDECALWACFFAYAFWVLMVTFLIVPSLDEWMHRSLPGVEPRVAARIGMVLWILPSLLALLLPDSSDNDVGKRKYWHTRK